MNVFQDEGITTIASPDTLGVSPVNPSHPRLQKSASDPSDLQSFSRRESAVGGLDRCLSLLSVLGCKVDRVTGFITTMPGTCKQCHGETGKEHVGSKWGFDHCNLPHNDGCLGGIEEIPGKRKACPVGFVPTKVVSGNETEVSQQKYSDLETASETESDPDEADLTKTKLEMKIVSSEAVPSVPNLVTLNGPESSIAANSLSLLGSSITTTGINSLPLMSSGFPTHNAALGGAASLLLGGFASSMLGGVTSQATGLPTSGFPQPPSDLSQSWLLQQYLQQQQTMQLQQQQQQAILQENQRVMKEMQSAVEEAKRAARSAASVRRKSSVSFSDALVSEAEALKSTNSRDNVSQSVNLGRDMNDVRKTSGLRDTVEKVMEQEVYSHASLARTPTAGTNIGATQHIMQPGVPDNSQAAAVIAALQAELVEKQKSLDAALGPSQQNDSKHERRAARRAARADRRTAVEKLAAAKTETKLAKRAARKLGVTGLSSSSDSSTESDEDLDRTITKKKKLKKKLPVNVTNLGDSSDEDDELPSVLTDERGRAYKVVAGKLEALPTYVRDPVSGKMIRTTPSASGASCARSGSSSDSSDERKAKKKEKKLRQKSKRAGERQNAGSMQGITPLRAASHPLPPVPNLQDNRGKSLETKQNLSVVDWAKMCPIKYASTCTSKNLNLPVFMWARLAELRALNAGALETGLKPGELDARLRHMQCVLELVGTNSILTEYSGYGWQLGRDYDRKVQATMDSGASDWVTFNSMFSLGPHPSFVLSAKDEVEKVAKKANPQREDDPTKTKKKICGRFNSCRTSKRCEWEVENPNSGRCKRLHQCSYCKLTHNKSVFHQAWDCPSGGMEAVQAGTHTL